MMNTPLDSITPAVISDTAPAVIPTTAPSVTPAAVLPIADDVTALRSKLETTQSAYVSAVMEKNFLQRAMADLNFHHNAHDGIVFTDKENRVVYANPYFLRMMGITDPAELLNKPLPAYMWANPSDEAQLFKDIQDNGFVRERDLSLYNRNKQPIFVACSSVASKDDAGNFVGTEIMLCNVTTKHRIEHELIARTEELTRVKTTVHTGIHNVTEAVTRGATSTELIDALKQIDTAVGSPV